MLEKLEKYYNDGLLIKQVHPTKDLTIWNYSTKVQYDRLWDEVTLMARGLVTNSKGEIIARPFTKFFNYEEYLGFAPELIPVNEPFDLFEKMDGSLGIVFYYDGEWIIATRGSFTSEQAIRGKEILDREYNLTWINKTNTYLFEIIYPENRIVVDYNGKEKLVLLGVIGSKTGHEYSYEYLDIVANLLVNDEEKAREIVVKKYNGITNYKEVKAMVKDDQEGFVVRFKNGFRMKIKGEEYCRLHRIMTHISNRDIWDVLKTEDKTKLYEILDKVPDEFYNWVKDTIADLENRHELIMGETITNFWIVDDIVRKEEMKLGNGLVYDEREYAKKFAEEAFKFKNSHLLFSYRKELLNPVRTRQSIWDMVYPKFQKPFKNDDEE